MPSKKNQNAAVTQNIHTINSVQQTNVVTQPSPQPAQTLQSNYFSFATNL